MICIFCGTKSKSLGMPSWDFSIEIEEMYPNLPRLQTKWRKPPSPDFVHTSGPGRAAYSDRCLSGAYPRSVPPSIGRVTCVTGSSANTWCGPSPRDRLTVIPSARCTKELDAKTADGPAAANSPPRSARDIATFAFIFGRSGLRPYPRELCRFCLPFSLPVFCTCACVVVREMEGEGKHCRYLFVLFLFIGITYRRWQNTLISN